jgi:hypothetical protein
MREGGHIFRGAGQDMGNTWCFGSGQTLRHSLSVILNLRPVVSMRTLPPASLKLYPEFRHQILPKGLRSKKTTRTAVPHAPTIPVAFVPRKKPPPAHEKSDSHVNNKVTAPHDFNSRTLKIL